MRKKGCVCEFTQERDEELVRCFRRQLASVRVIDLPKIFRELPEMGASRFFVSEMRAREIVGYHMRHGVWKVKSKVRREMFEEIERRVLEAMAEEPSLSMSDAMFEVVNSPAPRFYLTPRTVRTLIYELLKLKH